MSHHNADLCHAVRHLRSTPRRLLEEPHEGSAIAGQSKGLGSAIGCYRPSIHCQPQPQCSDLPSAEPHHRDMPDFVVRGYDDCWMCIETHDAPPIHFL